MTAQEFNSCLLNIRTDTKAVEKIYIEYLPMLKCHISRRFGNAVDIDDIISEMFIKLMQTDWSIYPSVETPASWLYKITDNLVKDKLKSKTHCEVSIDFFVDVASDFDLEKIFIRNEVKEQLLQLDEITAKAIYLNKYEGYTYEEISKMLNISAEALRTRVSRAYDVLEKKYVTLFSPESSDE